MLMSNRSRLARLHYLTGEPAYRERAEAIIDAFSGELRQNLFPLGTLLNNAELLNDALQIVIVGAPDAEDTRALLRVVNGMSLPNRILSVVADTADLPESHPAASKTGAAGCDDYVCRGQTCSVPISDAEALADALAG